MAGGAQETAKLAKREAAAKLAKPEAAAKLAKLLAPAVEANGLDLEELTISRAGNRSVVRIAVDRDGGVDLDAVATATRAINEILDAHEDLIPGAYALEVGSPGVDRPLTLPRHWRRAIGRLVTVSRSAGGDVTGRVSAATEDGATLQVGGVETIFAYDEVRRAVVQVEFTRPDEIDDEINDEFNDSEEVSP